MEIILEKKNDWALYILSIEKWWKLLYVILNRSEGERKKESKRETYKQVAVKRKERKMAPVDRYCPCVKMIDGS